MIWKSLRCLQTIFFFSQFFNQVLILGKAEAELSIARKVYDLIYELYNISPGILLSILPQLEFKLKSTEETERMGSVSLLARMFSGNSWNKYVKLVVIKWQSYGHNVIFYCCLCRKRINISYDASTTMVSLSWSIQWYKRSHTYQMCSVHNAFPSKSSRVTR